MWLKKSHKSFHSFQNRHCNTNEALLLPRVFYLSSLHTLLFYYLYFFHKKITFSEEDFILFADSIKSQRGVKVELMGRESQRHWIMKCIKGKGGKFGSNNKGIQIIYINCLFSKLGHHLLGFLPGTVRWIKEQKSCFSCWNKPTII